MLSHLNLIPLWLITLLFAGLLYLAVYGGARLRRVIGTDPATVSGGQLISGSMTVLSLLIGFTFSLALNRHDQRRDLLLEESNAIRSLNRTLVHVEEPGRGQIRTALTTYTKGRLAYVERNLIEQDALVPRLIAEREQFNQIVANVTPSSKSGVTGAQVLVGATRILDAGTRMEMISVEHVPARVVLVIVLLSTGTAMLIGISLAEKWSTLKVPIAMWSLMLSMALFTIVDLDAPRWGSIQLDPAPMRNALRSLAPAPGMSP